VLCGWALSSRQEFHLWRAALAVTGFYSCAVVAIGLVFTPPGLAQTAEDLNRAELTLLTGHPVPPTNYSRLAYWSGTSADRYVGCPIALAWLIRPGCNFNSRTYVDIR